MAIGDHPPRRKCKANKPQETPPRASNRDGSTTPTPTFGSVGTPIAPPPQSRKRTCRRGDSSLGNRTHCSLETRLDQRTLLDGNRTAGFFQFFLQLLGVFLRRPSLILAGTPSTRSLASFSPRLVTGRTTLITPIFLSPKLSRRRRIRSSRPRPRPRRRRRRGRPSSPRRRRRA